MASLDRRAVSAEKRSAEREAEQALPQRSWMLGLYRDNGKENRNYRDYRGYIRVIWGLHTDYRVYIGVI